MGILGSYKNGNYNVTILSDGTKIRSNNEDYFKADFPESMDIKICNKCDMGCPMCHENSTPNGEIPDIMSENFIDKLNPYTELACLSGDTVVHSEKGSIDIKDLVIGDYIYDSEYKLRKIINIQTSNKDCYRIKGYRGLNVISSSDHPFMVSNEQVKAIDLIGKTIDQLKCAEDGKEEYIIDMGKHIKFANKNKKNSRGGKFLDDGRIMLRHNTAPIPRYINLTPELMYAYGLYVAEGDKRYYTLNINEKEMAQKVGKIWVDTFKNSYYSIQLNEESNSLNLSLSPQTLLQDLFVVEMKSGKGARNKNLEYLYHINNKELIRWALIGLIDGDGCFRKRQGEIAKNMYTTSLKTTSKKLAYDFSYLLMKWFGIKTSIYHGMSPERKIYGRILKPSDYYMVDFYGYEDCKKLFGDYYGELIPTVENYRRKHDNVVSVEKTNNEILYDITLDGGTHVFPINGYWLTHNCGGGNPLEHPDLIPFLEKCKKLKLIPSMTVNQVHFMKNIDLITELIDKKLIYGLGISLVNVDNKLINILTQRKFSNVVIHVINGIVSMAELEALRYFDIKILILGYKDFRRGHNLYSIDNKKKAIDGKKEDLKRYLPEIINDGWFKTVSFDNLALKQLDVKNIMSDEDWQKFYMGDDGQATMYIDMCKREFAKSSVSTERYPLMDNIIDMFNVIKNESNK